LCPRLGRPPPEPFDDASSELHASEALDHTALATINRRANRNANDLTFLEWRRSNTPPIART
jgi:hypothetical protein